MWISGSAAAGIRPKVSISGPSARSGASSSAARSSSSSTAPSITTSWRPLRNGGSSGSGGKLITRIDVVTESGSSRVHRPRANHLGGALAVPQQHAGVHVGDRQQLELERDDDAEVAAAAAQRPEQLGVVLGVGAHHRAVGGHHLHRADRLAASPCWRPYKDSPPPSA